LLKMFSYRLKNLTIPYKRHRFRRL